MALANRIGGALPLAAGALLAGALAALLPPAGSLLIAMVIGLFLLVALMRYRAGAGAESTWHPVVLVLTGFAVLTVTWNGFPPSSVSAPDLILVAALFAVGYCWLQGTIELPLPGWLLGAAGILFAMQFLDQFFLLPNPPADPPPSFTPPGPAILTMSRFELAFLVVPIVIGAVASSWRRVNLLANLWLVSATISAMIATFDGFTGAGLGTSITGVDVNEGSRAAGLAIHPNTFALTCAMTLPVALLRAFEYRGLWRAGAIVAACFLCGGVLVSGSRVGLVSLVIAIGLTAMLIPKLRPRIVVIGLTGIVLTLLVAPTNNPLLEGIDRLSGGGDSTEANGQRSDQFHESLAIALDHPVTGIGFQVVADAHSLPLQFWETAGFLGIAALILYATGAIQTGLRLYRDPQGLPRGSPLLAAVLTICFAVWLIAGLLQNEIADRYIYVPVGLLLGLGLAAKASISGDEQSEPGKAEAADRPRRPVRVPAEPERVPVAS